MKEIVHLRQKPLKNGGASFYLDIYLDGRRSYEFLKLYTRPEKTRADRDFNKQVMQTANAAKAQRIIELQNAQHGVAQRPKVWLYGFVAQLIEAHSSEATKLTWRNFANHLEQFTQRDILIGDIDVRFVDGFKRYLETATSAKYPTRPLSNNTQSLYFAKLKATINEAQRLGIIDKNPGKLSHNITLQDSERPFLTIDELRALITTPCSDPETRRAFLFSCLTGLRRSDIEQLTWANIQAVDGATRIVFTQKKTKGREYLDISEQAEQLLGNRKSGEIRVFKLPNVTATNRIIDKWTHAAGIVKNLTFHCARHTFATMLLANGVDIFTVSKLLGHRNVSTTQIYAKVLDEAKRRAVNQFPRVL